MLTVDKLKLLTTMTPTALTQVVQASGYTEDKFNECRFLGITDSGQFCYEVEYDDVGTLTNTKLFVKYDSGSGLMTADY